MHEIKLYGEIAHITHKNENNVTLQDVQNQLSSADGSDVKVRIASDGGDAEEGFAIYNELRRYAKTNNAKIHTFAESRLASIATVIFLAGDERELSSDLQPFIHKAYIDTDHDLLDFQKKGLADINNRIAQHYANHTELTFQEALDLMEGNTWISTEEAKAMRFATSIEKVLRPIALQRFNSNYNKYNMNKKTQTLLNKAMRFLKTIQNKIVETADGGELDFYELAEDAVIETGVKAYYDGSNAEGDFLMLTGETYVFEGGILIEIKPAEELVTVEELQVENKALKDQLEAMLNKAFALEVELKSKTEIISNYKNSTSKAVPSIAKTSPVKDDIKPKSLASKAALNFNQFNLKK